MSDDARIREAWRANAEAWTRAVRERHIGSRVRVTDAAVIEAVMAHAPRTAIDLGCGEGWLVCALAERGVDTLGVDAEPALIEAARAAGGGHFEALRYSDIVAGCLAQRADVVIANFALLGAEGVDEVLRAGAGLVEPSGALIVQTVHPWVACGDGLYVDGWREERWEGFGIAFNAPSPWYFRTLEGWLELFRRAGLTLQRMREPVDPQSGRPASIIFELEVDARLSVEVASY